MNEANTAATSNTHRFGWKRVCPPSRPRRPGTATVRRALDFMETNLGERFTLHALAASAGCSRFHFARLFRACMGESPMEYLMRLRVERGRQLLERGGQSICEIAVLLGFCDQSHFTRRFRDHTGMSPRDYARKRQGARRQAPDHVNS
jgi:AraC family transcriptional regulator